MKKKRLYEKPILKIEKLEETKQESKEETDQLKEKSIKQQQDGDGTAKWTFLRCKSRRAILVVSVGVVLCTVLGWAFWMDQAHTGDGAHQEIAVENTKSTQNEKQERTISSPVQSDSSEAKGGIKPGEKDSKNTPESRVEETKREERTDTEKTETEAASTPAAMQTQTEKTPISIDDTETEESLPLPTVMPPVQAATGSVPVHTHAWTPQTQTIHHDAVKESVYVIDEPAYEEPIYGDEPVYETYGVEICGVCGAELHSPAEVSAHAESHIDWDTLENPFYYYTEWQQRQTGTQTVQTGTIYHEEVGHYEERLLQEAYEETVITGYICSDCGETR